MYYLLEAERFDNNYVCAVTIPLEEIQRQRPDYGVGTRVIYGGKITKTLWFPERFKRKFIPVVE